MLRNRVVTDIPTLVEFAEQCEPHVERPPTSRLLRGGLVRGFYHPLGGLVAGYILNLGSAPFAALDALPSVGPLTLAPGAEELLCEVSHVWLRSSLSPADRRAFYQALATDLLDSDRPYTLVTRQFTAAEGADCDGLPVRAVLYEGPGAGRPPHEVTRVSATRTEEWVRAHCAPHIERPRTSVAAWLALAAEHEATAARAQASGASELFA
ncbi:MAG: hypothetical protein H6744_10680 [Deltaproteobacteria bacterium]|nr:hypothetical protein [Deltaproteobacteria bacterium]